MDEGNEHPIYMVEAYSNLIAEINALERQFMSANLIQAMSNGVI
jgi:hypothetical protein